MLSSCEFVDYAVVLIRALESRLYVALFPSEQQRRRFGAHHLLSRTVSRAGRVPYSTGRKWFLFLRTHTHTHTHIQTHICNTNKSLRNGIMYIFHSLYRQDIQKIQQDDLRGVKKNPETPCHRNPSQSAARSKSRDILVPSSKFRRPIPGCRTVVGLIHGILPFPSESSVNPKLQRQMQHNPTVKVCARRQNQSNNALYREYGALPGPLPAMPSSAALPLTCLLLARALPLPRS